MAIGFKTLAVMASQPHPRKKDALNNVKPINRKPSPSNKDQLWKDMLQHERQLMKLWRWKWDLLLQPEFCIPTATQQKDDPVRKDQTTLHILPQPLHGCKDESAIPSIPVKTSEWIGWRAKDRIHSLDMYLTKPTRPPKIRFQDEQYGKYRHLKYLMMGDDQDQEIEKLPKRIRHVVKPLLC